MPNVIERQRVIDCATRLFGELGYDGTPLQLIAASLGVSTSTVQELAGDRYTIYIEVMQQAFDAERIMLEKAMAQAGPGQSAVHEIVDAYLDFHVAHPRNRALWTQRWVSDAADLAELEDRFVRPLFKVVARRIREVVPPDVDTYYLIGTMVWSVHGFLGSGVFDRTQGIRRADDPMAVEDFRQQMHVLMDRMLAPRPLPARPSPEEAVPGKPAHEAGA